ncbi:MAG: RNA polymerase sigma factor [Phycisphaerae bacterium]
MKISGDNGDFSLIAAAQRGERDALDALVRRHEPWVRHVVYATVGHPAGVDDIVQHVWANVWQQIGTLVDPARWRGWLYKMARNAAIDAGLKNARERQRRATASQAEWVASDEAGPVESLSRSETHRRVLRAVRGLPAIYREPFILRHLEDWSYARIAEAMSLPVGTVETRLVRARRLLRSALKDLDPKQTESNATLRDRQS